MNRTSEFGLFVVNDLDQLNFFFDLNLQTNLSVNQTDNLTDVNSFYFYEHEQLTMLWILFASIVLGNSSVLIALLLDKSRSSRFNYFIKHLAIADLSVGFVSVLTDIIWKLTIEWNAGNLACKVVRYSQAVVTYSSTYLLVALTIDRYDAIINPMNFFKSWRRAKFLVMSAWILSLLFSIPIIVLYEEKTVQGHLQCWIEFIEPWHWQMYMVLISLTVFFIPAFIIVGCYATIIYTIWSHPNMDRKIPKHNFSTSPEFLNDDLNCKRVSSRGLIPKAKVKTVKMTLIIVFVFIFCWSPYIIFDLLQVFGYIKKTQTNIAVATFIQSLAPLNSAANPIVYCLFSTYICRHLRILPSFNSISKCCFGSKLRKGVKISDTSTSTMITHATSGRYINLHNLTRLEHLSNTNKKILRQSELSQRAKAFSVESLLSEKHKGKVDVVQKESKEKSKTDGSFQKMNGVVAELCCNELWGKFNRLGTEMIITRAGRRMFPSLKIRLQGLALSITYIVYMDIVLVGETKYRYNYQRSEWTIVGPSNNESLSNIYIHPDSPAKGEVWTSRGHISFDKVKLTNHRRPLMKDQVSLNSMHKYQPRIHVLEVKDHEEQQLDPKNINEYIRKNSYRASTFVFEQTSFITVTAYQNQEITNLKIQSNPFAKGFRELYKTRKQNRYKAITINN